VVQFLRIFLFLPATKAVLTRTVIISCIVCHEILIKIRKKLVLSESARSAKVMSYTQNHLFAFVNRGDLEPFEVALSAEKC
jgi:hypothetical protein